MFSYGIRVTPVVLNYRNVSDTICCIEALVGAGYGAADIVIVDNYSGDDSVDRLQSAFPASEVIRTTRNLGFAAGCNVGIRRACERGCEYVLLINNDVTVKPGFLDAAVATADSNPLIGIVAGKTYFASDPERIWDAGEIISWSRCQNLRRGSGDLDRGQFDVSEPVDAATGALMIIRADVFEKVGLLPEEYFMGMETEEFSLRAREAGYSVQYIPELVAWHEVGAASPSAQAWYLYNIYRHKLLFFRRNSAAWIYPYCWTYLRLRAETHRWRLGRGNSRRPVWRALARAFADHRRKGRVDEGDYAFLAGEVSG
jgi:GT2 family glycosyltransferase